MNLIVPLHLQETVQLIESSELISYEQLRDLWNAAEDKHYNLRREVSLLRKEDGPADNVRDEMPTVAFMANRIAELSDSMRMLKLDKDTLTGKVTNTTLVQIKAALPAIFD